MDGIVISKVVKEVVGKPVRLTKFEIESASPMFDMNEGWVPICRAKIKDSKGTGWLTEFAFREHDELPRICCRWKGEPEHLWSDTGFVENANKALQMKGYKGRSLSLSPMEHQDTPNQFMLDSELKAKQWLKKEYGWHPEKYAAIDDLAGNAADVVTKELKKIIKTPLTDEQIEDLRVRTSEWMKTITRNGRSAEGEVAESADDWSKLGQAGALISDVVYNTKKLTSPGDPGMKKLQDLLQKIVSLINYAMSLQKKVKGEIEPSTLEKEPQFIETVVIGGITHVKVKGAWTKLPKGWTKASLKKFWKSLTGDKTHKVTQCIKKMTGKMDNPEAFCGSLASKVGYR